MSLTCRSSLSRFLCPERLDDMVVAYGGVFIHLLTLEFLCPVLHHFYG